MTLPPPDPSAEIDRLARELESAEAYEMRLRQVIVDVRDMLASGKSYAELSELAAQAPRGSAGLIFVPYLTGERHPHRELAPPRLGDPDPRHGA